MDDLSNDGSESPKSDVMVVSNPVMKKKSPSKKVQTIDAFILTAEGTIAELEELLRQYPGTYNEKIEVQHCTVKDTMHAAERFLCKTPHTEQDTITHTVKRLWHVNNRYAYRQWQAEKKRSPPPPPTSPQPQQILIPQTSPVPQTQNFPTAARCPIAKNRPSAPSSPIPHSPGRKS